MERRDLLFADGDNIVEFMILEFGVVLEIVAVGTNDNIAVNSRWQRTRGATQEGSHRMTAGRAARQIGLLTVATHTGGLRKRVRTE